MFYISSHHHKMCYFHHTSPVCFSAALDILEQFISLPYNLLFQPERIDPRVANQGYDVRSDVWSLGITLVRHLYDAPVPMTPYCVAFQLQNQMCWEQGKQRYLIKFIVYLRTLVSVSNRLVTSLNSFSLGHKIAILCKQFLSAPNTFVISCKIRSISVNIQGMRSDIEICV